MNMPINPQAITQTQSSHKMLRMKQLIEQTGLSRSTLYEMMDVKSKRYDPTFPRGIKLTEATVCWLESEVNAWIDSKIKQNRGL
jgi:prophage regulatory protein